MNRVVQTHDRLLARLNYSSYDSQLLRSKLLIDGYFENYGPSTMADVTDAADAVLLD
jgi:hypothetical protein